MVALRIVLSFVFMLASVLTNVCALTAMKRSRTLSPNIRMLSMNLLVSNILFSTVGVVLLLLGIDFASGNVSDKCFARLVGSAVSMEAYFVTSFSIIAMAMDRLGAIMFPFKYIEFLHRDILKKVCIFIWGISFFIVTSHNIVNRNIISSCIYSDHVSAKVLLGILSQTIIVVGISNLIILLLNVFLFSVLLTYVMKKNYKQKVYAISILRKLTAIFVAYAILYIPFCMVTIATSVIDGYDPRIEPYENISSVLLLFAFIVDPFLYAWRYKMCRLHMMRIMCFFRKSKMEEITYILNDHYCSYKIGTTLRTTSSVV